MYLDGGVWAFPTGLSLSELCCGAYPMMRTLVRTEMKRKMHIEVAHNTHTYIN